MSTYISTPNTVQELIDVLNGLSPESKAKPVRVLTMSHEFPPDIREHERCVTLEP